MQKSEYKKKRRVFVGNQAGWSGAAGSYSMVRFGNEEPKDWGVAAVGLGSKTPSSVEAPCKLSLFSAPWLCCCRHCALSEAQVLSPHGLCSSCCLCLEGPPPTSVPGWWFLIIQCSVQFSQEAFPDQPRKPSPSLSIPLSSFKFFIALISAYLACSLSVSPAGPLSGFWKEYA